MWSKSHCSKSITVIRNHRTTMDNHLAARCASVFMSMTWQLGQSHDINQKCSGILESSFFSSNSIREKIWRLNNNHNHDHNCHLHLYSWIKKESQSNQMQFSSKNDWHLERRCVIDNSNWIELKFISFLKWSEVEWYLISHKYTDKRYEIELLDWPNSPTHALIGTIFRFFNIVRDDEHVSKRGGFTCNGCQIHQIVPKIKENRRMCMSFVWHMILLFGGSKQKRNPDIFLEISFNNYSMSIMMIHNKIKINPFY